uniref:Type II secretion system protein M n=1 Tax=Candidatus Kentrum sp. FM TaxID=2126340 RepID=A0A450THD5_9GAMM|nr:MAG: Type II secretory pathway, component PulM [Candidatus Kentron sp. FM]VFJ66554.1 MAG: Type II secretory pathway, component PulM [Candidatus Kentron sp. FM]VFK18741.1 MAG: Type II secretory pathway, component PulM [Candidatus Kentron sp. FM]
MRNTGATKTITAFLERIKLDTLGPRDRVALAIGTLAVMLAFLWFVVIEPLYDKAGRLAGQISKQEADLQWMRYSAREIHRLRENASVGQGERAHSESLLSIVDRSAKKIGISRAVKRIEPAGEAGVQVWIEAAAFDNLLLWLGDLRASGVGSVGISVERLKTPGHVNAKATLGWLY